ncbi:MAG: hypothetical protein FVQ77_11825 [Cytophagales bacterium]|nr:hypothetical protein [Cytophagales bacterium]
MKNLQKLIIINSVIIITMISFNVAFAQNEFTQKDREFLIELRVTMGELRVTIEQMEKRIDQRFQQMEKRIDDIQTYMLWGFGILFACMLGLFGSIVGLFMREREIEIKPAEKKLYSSTKREKLIESILKDYAKKQPELSEIIKMRGL